MSRNHKAKETVLVITVGCLALYLLVHRRGFLYAALGIGVAGIFSSYLSAKIDWLWMGLSKVLGKVSNTVLLSAVFIFVVTPVGLIRRWGRKDRMRRFDRSSTGNFIDRDHTFTGKDMENPW
jgi:hypothetical protein